MRAAGRTAQVNVYRALALLLLATVLVLLGFTYFGHGSSPYGMCEATNGQLVTCDLLEPTPR